MDVTCGLRDSIGLFGFGVIAGGFVAFAIAQRWPHVLGLRRNGT